MLRGKPEHGSITELRVMRGGTAPIPEPGHPGAALDILVSDALARYWILDRPAGLAGIAELDAYATDRFVTIYGDEADDWVIRVDPVPGADRWLACAIPVRIAIDLPHAVAERGWRLRGVRPRFVHEFNQHCRALGPDVAFCVASSESTTIGLIRANRWCGIRVHPPLDRAKVGFPTLLRRDCRQAGIAAEGLSSVVVGSRSELARQDFS